MRDSILDMSRFRALLADLNWPEALVGTERIAGEAAWRDLLPVTARSDRASALRGMGDALLEATSDGRKRILEYRDRGPRLPALAPPDELANYLHEHVLYFGDLALLKIVVQGLHTAPLCVVEAVLDDVVWLGVGRGSRAWTCSAKLVDRENRSRSRLVMLGPDADELTIRHEAAHTWHAPLPATDGRINEAITAVGEAGFREYARVAGFGAAVDEHEFREERLAEACAFVWS